MWKRYDELNRTEKGVVTVNFSFDRLVMGDGNVDEVRRRYGYWCDDSGFVSCRKPTHQIVDWNQTTLY
jgi:hypothetical protein